MRIYIESCRGKPHRTMALPTKELMELAVAYPDFCWIFVDELIPAIMRINQINDGWKVEQARLSTSQPQDSSQSDLPCWAEILASMGSRWSQHAASSTASTAKSPVGAPAPAKPTTFAGMAAKPSPPPTEVPRQPAQHIALNPKTTWEMPPLLVDKSHPQFAPAFSQTAPAAAASQPYDTEVDDEYVFPDFD